MRTIRAVLVGCGGMSGAWVNAAKQISGLTIAAFVDIYEEAARKRAADYADSDALVGTDLPAILDAVKPDVVFDCTIPEAHAGVTLQALSHGCHVMGEKPMADSMENARKVATAAKDAGKIYAVIQNRRYDPNIRRLRSFIESGAIGPLTTVNCDFYIGAHFGGFRDRMKHVLLLDMAIHTFDAARYLTGADPVSVYCKEWNPAGSWYDHDASAVAIFEMTGGIVYTYRGSWCAEGLNTTWECDWRFIAESGSAKWNGSSGFEAASVAERGGFHSKTDPVEIPPFDAGDKVGGHNGLIKEFIRCVRSGETPETVCTDNIKSLAMVFGAIESAEKGTPVSIRW